MMSSHVRKYRIGLDARFYRAQTGGIGRYTREVIDHLSRVDTTNEYFVFLTEADVPEWHCENPNFHPVITTVKHYSLTEQTAFLKLLNSYKLDLVHFFNFNHPVAYRRPFIVTLHDLTLLHKPESRKKGPKAQLRRQAFLQVFKHSLTAARKVIAVSEFTAHDAEKTLGTSHAKMEVIYEGAPYVRQIEFGSKKTVQDYLGTKEPYILFVSQWREHKGITTLLDAFNELKTTYNLPHKLALLGKQDAATLELKEKIASLPAGGDVIMPGFAPDELLPALYTYASAFAMPSEYEGFGLPVLEALSYAAPTVVANNSSLPEVGGDGVLYFETGNAHDLAGKIYTMLTDEAVVKELQMKGLKQVQNFRWDKAARQTHKLYLSVLEKGR